VCRNGNGDKLSEFVEPDSGVGRKQTPARRDHLHARDAAGRLRKMSPVSQLSAEVESAAKGKNIGELGVSYLRLPCQFERRLGPCQQLCAASIGPSRGEHKHTLHFKKAVLSARIMNFTFPVPGRLANPFAWKEGGDGDLGYQQSATAISSVTPSPW
jgi:hypothetical protein